MIREYGSKEKGEEVFYASVNAGKITGVDDADYQPVTAMTLSDVRNAANRLRGR